MLTTIMIGNKIQKARKDKNFSQADLARKISVSPQAVGKWERGESMPDIITFSRLAEILGVDLNYFSETFGADTAQETQQAELKYETTQAPVQKRQSKRTLDMSMASWEDADFSGLENLHDKFSSSNIRRCKFIASDLSSLLLKGNNVDGCDFSEANLSGIHILNSNVVKNTFSKSNITGSKFTGSHIKECYFISADFTSAELNACNFTKCEIHNALWNGTAFVGSQLSDITFASDVTDCTFENCAMTRVVFEGVHFKNTFFKNTKLKKTRFINCKADKMSYEFILNGKADMTEIELIQE